MTSMQSIHFSGKRVFVRVDFNVPLDPEGNVSDDTRIVAALPTIKYLLGKGAKVILGSHLGRPKKTRDPRFSLKPVASELAKLLDVPILFVEDILANEALDASNDSSDGSVILLENLRFYPGEESNDPEFSKKLAQFADVYINDAFGTAHRAHASTTGLPALIGTKAAGFLMERELEFLSSKTSNPEHPFVVVLGGAKVSDKIHVIEALLDKADVILIGGAMAYTFALALGKKVGSSLSEPNKVQLAKLLLEKAKAKNVKFLLPVDNLITDNLDFKERRLGNTNIIANDIPDGWEGVDVGPKTIALYAQELQHAKTILWNGPMGVFEISESAKGTFDIAKAVALSHALSIIGGGDSVKALKSSGYSDKVSFISTGGGASLKLLEGRELPGVEALKLNKVLEN